MSRDADDQIPEGQRPRGALVDRGKRSADVTVLARAESVKAFLRIVQISKDAEVDVRVRMDANKYIIDRAIGKPAQAVAVSGPNGEALPITISIGGMELTSGHYVNGTNGNTLGAMAAPVAGITHRSD